MPAAKIRPTEPSADKNSKQGKAWNEEAKAREKKAVDIAGNPVAETVDAKENEQEITDDRDAASKPQASGGDVVLRLGSKQSAMVKR